MVVQSPAIEYDWTVGNGQGNRDPGEGRRD